MSQKTEYKYEYGKVLGEPEEKYHANNGAMTSTRIKTFLKREMVFKDQYIDGNRDTEEKPHFVVGKAGHALILEGEEEYRERFYAVPEDAPRYPTDLQRNAKKPSPKTVEAVAWWDEFEKNNKGKQKLTHEQDAMNREVFKRIQASPICRAFLDGGQTEVTWRMKGKPFDLQVRTDRYNADPVGVAARITEGSPYILDLKSCNSLEEDFRMGTFHGNVIKLGYHVQAAFYLMVVSRLINFPLRHFFFLAYEKNPPYEVGVFQLDGYLLDLGREQVKYALDALKDRFESGNWQGIPQDRVNTIVAPEWFTRKGFEQVAMDEE